MDTVVIYPGRFHPFHKGHKSVYDALVKRFGKNRVYIATSNKVDPPKSPFTFDEKRAMMALTGVDPSRVVQVKNPYQATEITDNFDPQNTIALFAVSDKDMAEDPRFSFKPRKDGQPSYYQPASKDMQGFDKHGYIVTVPTLQFNVLGKPMRSASEFRANFAQADSETQKAMITDLFGQYDPKTHNTMAQKIVEQLIRADEILDKLIEMGADDCYILEACIRVESLVESINMKQRKQTLYQAIMEGGHSLPEQEVAQEEITDFNTEDPMNSVIAIRGIGTMSISSALEKVSEMAMDIAKLGAMKDAKNVQDNLPRYMDLLATYNESIQEAYRELAQQRKRGGTASRGIDKDISEALSDEEMDAFHVELDKLVHKYFGHSSDEKKMDEGKKTWMKDGVEMCSKDCCGAPVTECTCGPDCKHCDCYKINEVMDQDRLNKFLGKKDDDDTDYKKDLEVIPIGPSGGRKKPGYRPIIDLDDLDGFNEHCGDPMAHDHAPGRTLLMKLYKKEMQCKPGSPEHFEVMQMIDGCRKNIGLEEGMWDDAKKAVSGAAKAVTNKVASDYNRRNKLFNKGKV
jgi:cytidyltransferase-like protein